MAGFGLIPDGVKNFGAAIFQFVTSTGIGAVLRVPAADLVEFRDLLNAAYAVVRGAPPVGDDDFVTKGYLTGVGAPGLVRCIGITPGTSTASSTTVVALGRVMTRLNVNITTPYSVGATIAVSAGGNPLAAAGAINAQATGVTSIELLEAAAANGPLTVTVAGAPVAGACMAWLEYGTPNP